MPFYLLLVGVLVVKYRFNALWIVLAIGLTIALSDQFASGFCKPFFERLRPSHEPALAGRVHLYQLTTGEFYRGGRFGFISSHAANSFGVAAFFFLLWRRKYRYVGWFFGWATLVSYSRIALGVHYPADIVFGALSGVLWAWVAFRLLIFLWNKLGKGELLRAWPLKEV